MAIRPQQQKCHFVLLADHVNQTKMVSISEVQNLKLTQKLILLAGSVSVGPLRFKFQI